MSPRLLRPRLMRWLLTGLVIASLAVLGWTWGKAGIDKPAVSLGYAVRNEVRVWTTHPQASVYFSWTTEPTGVVRITVQLARGSGDTDTVTVLVALVCDTRYDDYGVDSANHATLESKIAGDDERGCGEEPSQASYLARPTQLLLVQFTGKLAGTDSIAIEGTTVERWSDEAAGERVAYTPYVQLGGRFPLDLPRLRDLVDEGVEPVVPATADVYTSVEGLPSEIAGTYFPTDTPLAIFGTNIGATGEVRTEQTPQGPRITWSADWSASTQQGRGVDFPSYTHTTAVVRWSDSGGLARAQFRLLLAGLFLGIVGSVVIEGLFAWARWDRTESPRS